VPNYIENTKQLYITSTRCHKN